MIRPTRVAALAAIALSFCVYGCSSGTRPPAATFNEAASLTGQLPENPLQWKVITSMVDRSAGTMSTLYGNDAAVTYARSNSGHDYPPGSEVALVTWSQREDPRWYGAKIPAEAKMVEFVSVSASPDGKPVYSYQEYEGTPLQTGESQSSSTLSDRKEFLLSLRAAVLP
jgi:Cytochrome P460